MEATPLYSLPLRKSSVCFGFAFLGKGEGVAFTVCFSVLTMCNDTGQVFVSFEGDIFSISFFMVLVWRLAEELEQLISQKLVEMIWKGDGFVFGFLFF